MAIVAVRCDDEDDRHLDGDDRHDYDDDHHYGVFYNSGDNDDNVLDDDILVHKTLKL